jgi:hypothetical protein
VARWCLCLAVGLSQVWFPTIAHAGHAGTSCGGSLTKQEGAITEPNYPGQKYGTRATITVSSISPSPPTYGIVKSIYLWERDNSIQNFVEVGYKWILAGPLNENEQYDASFNVFVAKMVNNSFYIVQKQTAGNPGNPGWGFLTEGEEVEFQIRRDTDNDHRFRFHRTDPPGTAWLEIGFLDNNNMRAGFSLSGTEASRICDSMHAHFAGLQKCNGPPGGGSYCYVWQDWSGVAKGPASYGFVDESDWFYWDPRANNRYYWQHCATFGCPDA